MTPDWEMIVKFFFNQFKCKTFLSAELGKGGEESGCGGQMWCSGGAFGIWCLKKICYETFKKWAVIHFD